MSKETKRPSVSAELYIRAQMYSVGKDVQPNHVFENALELMINEEGDKVEGLKRLEQFCDIQGLDQRRVLNFILTKVLDDDGELNIKYKEKIRADELES